MGERRDKEVEIRGKREIERRARRKKQSTFECACIVILYVPCKWEEGEMEKDRRKKREGGRRWREGWREKRERGGRSDERGKK